MRKGILSLSLPGLKKHGGAKKSTNIERAEKAANQRPETAVQPEAAAPAKEEAREQFVQTIQVPKKSSLLKGVTRKHKDLAARARKRQEELEKHS